MCVQWVRISIYAANLRATIQGITWRTICNQANKRHQMLLHGCTSAETYNTCGNAAWCSRTSFPGHCSRHRFKGVFVDQNLSRKQSATAFLGTCFLHATNEEFSACTKTTLPDWILFMLTGWPCQDSCELCLKAPKPVLATGRTIAVDERLLVGWGPQLGGGVLGIGQYSQTRVTMAVACSRESAPQEP